jgi:hypothetical protein
MLYSGPVVPSTLGSKWGCRPSPKQARAGAAVLVCGLACLLTSCSSDRQNARAAVRHPGFSLLDQRGGPNDAVPSQVTAALEADVSPEFTARDIRIARRVLPSESAWLVPAEGGDLCLVRLVYPLVSSIGGTPLGPAVAVGCNSEAAALAGRLVATQSLSATSAARTVPVRVIGIVPDGVENVSIRSGRGHASRVAVVQNAYEAVLRDPTEVLFEIRHGGRRTHTEVPLILASFSNAVPVQQPAGLTGK